MLYQVVGHRHFTAASGVVVVHVLIKKRPELPAAVRIRTTGICLRTDVVALRIKHHHIVGFGDTVVRSVVEEIVENEGLPGVPAADFADKSPLGEHLATVQGDVQFARTTRFGAGLRNVGVGLLTDTVCL